MSGEADPHELQRVSALLELGRAREARKRLEDGLLAESSDPAWAACLMAQSFLPEGDFEPAEMWSRKAIELAGEDSYTHFTLAFVLWKAKKYELAAESIARSLELKRQADYLSVAAHLECSLDRWDTALALAEEGLVREPDSTSCAIARYRAMYCRPNAPRDPEQGASLLEACPDSVQALIAVAQPLAHSQPGQAYPLLHMALRLHPESLKLRRACQMTCGLPTARMFRLFGQIEKSWGKRGRVAGPFALLHLIALGGLFSADRWSELWLAPLVMFVLLHCHCVALLLTLRWKPALDLLDAKELGFIRCGVGLVSGTVVAAGLAFCTGSAVASGGALLLLTLLLLLNSAIRFDEMPRRVLVSALAYAVLGGSGCLWLALQGPGFQAAWLWLLATGVAALELLKAES